MIQKPINNPSPTDHQPQPQQNNSQKDKQYQIKIPQEIVSAGKILGATYVQFGQTQCLAVYNSINLYFLEIVNDVVIRYSSYNMSNICSLVGIIKGYLLITTKEKKFWLFQLKKVNKIVSEQNKGVQNKKTDRNLQKIQQPKKNLDSNQKITPNTPNQQPKQQQKTLNVQSFLKQIPYTSYFIRQVTPNMIQIFITTAQTSQTSPAQKQKQKTNRIIYIYQFTVKQKVGGMGFTIDKNNKILNQSRKHLYASKNFYDSSNNMQLKFKNFSDVTFSVKKNCQEYVYILGINKTQQFYGITKNYMLVNIDNSGTSTNRRNITNQLNGFNLNNGITYLHYLLLQNNQGEVGLFMFQQGLKMRFLGRESKDYAWQICFNGKLVGVRADNGVVRVTREMSKRGEKQKGVMAVESVNMVMNVNLNTNANVNLKEGCQFNKISGKQQQDKQTVVNNTIANSISSSNPNFNKKQAQQICLKSPKTQKSSITDYSNSNKKQDPKYEQITQQPQQKSNQLQKDKQKQTNKNQNNTINSQTNPAINTPTTNTIPTQNTQKSAAQGWITVLPPQKKYKPSKIISRKDLKKQGKDNNSQNISESTANTNTNNITNTDVRNTSSNKKQELAVQQQSQVKSQGNYNKLQEKKKDDEKDKDKQQVTSLIKQPLQNQQKIKQPEAKQKIQQKQKTKENDQKKQKDLQKQEKQKQKDKNIQIQKQTHPTITPKNIISEYQQIITQAKNITKNINNNSSSNSKIQKLKILIEKQEQKIKQSPKQKQKQGVTKQKQKQKETKKDQIYNPFTSFFNIKQKQTKTTNSSKNNMLNIGSNDSNIISNVLSGSNNNSVTQNAVKPLVNSSKDKAKEQVVPSLQQKSIEKQDKKTSKSPFSKKKQIDSNIITGANTSSTSTPSTVTGTLFGQVPKSTTYQQIFGSKPIKSIFQNQNDKNLIKSTKSDNKNISIFSSNIYRTGGNIFTSNQQAMTSTGQNNTKAKSPFKKKQEKLEVLENQSVVTTSQYQKKSGEDKAIVNGKDNLNSNPQLDASTSSTKTNENFNNSTKQTQPNPLKTSLPPTSTSISQTKPQQSQKPTTPSQPHPISQIQPNQYNNPCCPNFQQTKLQYTKFTQKLLTLQSSTSQITQKFSQLSKQLISQLKSSQAQSYKILTQDPQQKITKIIQKNIQNSVNNYFNKKLNNKVNQYFKYVMNDTKKIYDNTLKFYSDKKKQSISSLQMHFQEQEHLVNQMRLITGDMLACIQNTVSEGEQSYGILLKQWERTSQKLCNKLDANLECVENHKHDRSASQRQKIIDSLGELREELDSQIMAREKEKELLRQKQIERERQIAIAKQKQKQKEIAIQKQQTKTKKQKSQHRKQKQKQTKSRKSKPIKQQKYHHHLYHQYDNRDRERQYYQPMSMPMPMPIPTMSMKAPQHKSHHVPMYVPVNMNVPGSYVYGRY